MSASEYLKWLRTASFARGATDDADLVEPGGIELAFAGRSNAGKSSVINRLCDNHKLARAAKTPGRTRQLQFFALTSQPPARWLVDLPGYGYARLPRSANPQEALVNYLCHRESLAALVLILDIRRGLGDEDQNLLEICRQRSLPHLLLLNKADKLSRAGVTASMRHLADTDCQMLAFSARTGAGLEQLALWVGQHLGR